MQDNKNFQRVLLTHINNIPGLILKGRIDYFKREGDDLVVNALSGSIDKEYMDGTREVSLTFEIAIRSKSNQFANDVIWLINGNLSDFEIDLPSTDDSYIFLSLDVEKPGINGKDEQGYFIYTMQLAARIELQGRN